MYQALLGKVWSRQTDTRRLVLAQAVQVHNITTIIRENPLALHASLQKLFDFVV